MKQLPVFDYPAMIAALDAQRVAAELGWTAVAEVLTDQSADLNAELADHAMCPGALVRNVNRHGPMSCQYALTILRWLDRAPEDFLTGPVVFPGAPLPAAGPESRLRFDLPLLHEALDAYRHASSLTWTALAETLDCTPSRLTNLRTARLADFELTMRVTQRLERPAADFISPARW